MNNYNAFAWDPVPYGLENVHAMIELNDLLHYPEIKPTVEPELIAEQLRAMPPGCAAMRESYFGQGYKNRHHPFQIRGHEEDRVIVNGSTHEYEGIWYQHGASKLAERCADWYGRLAEFSPPLDFLSLDSERPLFVKRLTTMHGHLLRQDLRAAVPGGLIERCGFSNFQEVASQEEDAPSARILQREFFRAYWTALGAGYQQVAELFPGVCCANWYGGIVNQRYAAPGRYRLRPMVVGTHAAPALYGTTRYASDAFEALRCDVNEIKANYLSAPHVPIAPWVGPAFGYKKSKYNYSPYWYELIYHCALNGTDLFQYFNPSKNPDLYGTQEERELSAKATDRTLAELNRHDILKGGVMFPMQSRGSVVASSAIADGCQLWRITAREDVTHVSWPIEAHIPPGQVGVWVRG